MAKFIGIGINQGPDIDDDFSGGNARDYLFGNIGNDTLSGGAGIDTMDGGDGDSDWVSFADATGGVVIDLTPLAFDTQAITMFDLSESSAELIGFEGATASIIGNWDGRSDVARVIKANDAGAAAGTTVALGANDSIDTIAFTASSTTMTLRVWVPEAGIVVRLKVEDSTDVTHTCEADALTTVSGGWETLTFDFSNAATNQGNPTAALNLNYTYDKVSVFFNFGVDGESGGDGTYYFDDLKFISDEGPSGTIGNDGFGNAETISNVENVLGSAQGDMITGSASSNTLSGAGGNDTINGGDGVDQLDGGSGVDTLSYAGADNGVEVELASGELITDIFTFEEQDAPTFAVFGPDNNPNATSAAIVDDPEGGDNQVGRFIKAAGAEVWAGVVVSTGDNFSVQEIPFTASDKTMTLRVWSAEAGTSVLVKLEDAADAGRNVGAEAVTTVAGGWETLTFTFGDALAGPNTGALNLDYTYNKAVVFFNFGLNGDDGGGTFFFDDLKFEGTAQSSVGDDGFGNVDEVSGFENVIGSAFADDITGDSGASVLDGLAGADRLSGGGGSDSLLGGDQADTLLGGGGDDTLNGGDGADSMTGGIGNDRYVVQSSSDLAIESADGGTDLVSASADYTLGDNIETLTLSGGASLSGTGNALANSLTGNTGANVLVGGDGADTLAGRDGADTLNGGVGKDSLDGGGGADRMEGGAANDSYVVQNSGDLIVELAGGGTDTVLSSVSYTLAAEVEKLTLSGTKAINANGNALNNTLVGNTADNSLRGSTGNDTLTGGDGADTFRFSSALNASTNVDRILDFSPVDDTLELENGVFAKLTTTGVLNSANFRASTSGNAVDANDFVLYETDTGKLFYDADGNGAGAKVLFATLTDLPTLASTDIFVT